MNKIFLLIKLILIFKLLFYNNLSLSDNLDLYRLSMPCLGCHHAVKESSIPSLCGLKEEYIFITMKDYQTGNRDNYLMQIISKGYSDAELINLSKYFSSIYSDRNCK